MAKSKSCNWLRKLARSANLLAYLVVLLTAPAVDSVLEARTSGHQTHVEAQTDAYCIPSHDAFCQLCRLIAVPAGAADRARIQTDTPARHTDGDVAGHRHAVSAAPRPQQPRAPPAVSH